MGCRNVYLYRLMTRSFLLLAFTLTLSCSQQKEPQQIAPSAQCPTILIAQAQFKSVTGPDGKTQQQPGPALLILKQKTPAGWKDIVIEDPQSNVFHKAIILKEDESNQEILTIGAMAAALKTWMFREKQWQQKTLWSPVFGGRWNRLRDMETGDINGDGKEEIVIATHDQGVVAVAAKKNKEWQVAEIDREPGIFVHEVEIGDVDGDGKNEFFVTPSKPNKAEGGPQPGNVVMYKWNGSRFDKTIIDTFEKTHAKEILAADITGKGLATLFSVVEAETKTDGGKTSRIEPVKIKQYGFKGGTISSTVIATLDDNQCRFLCAGDVDGDGKAELVASAMTSGIWLLKEKGAGSWSVTQIDASSSGYEHATCLADIDGDHVMEIIVASDDQGELREYKWNGSSFTKTLIAPIPQGRITWNLTYGMFR